MLRGARRRGLVLLTLALAGGALRVSLGTGFLLDDFYFLRRAQIGASIWDYAPVAGDRPIGSLILHLLFGVLGLPAWAFVLLMAALNGLVAVLLWRLLASLVDDWLAWGTGLAWIVLPSHSSLEAWPSTVPILVALVALLSALVVAAAPRLSAGAIAVVACLTAVAALTYESTGVFAIPLLLGVRWCVARRIDLGVLLPVALVASACLAWSASRWPEARAPAGSIADLPLVVPANFGWGVSPPGMMATVVLLTGLIAVAACIWVTRSDAAAPERRGLLVGGAVLCVGTGPYAFYLYEPFGVGDRFNYVSSFGGAIIWAAVTCWAVRRWPRYAGAALLGVGTLILAGRVHESLLWSRASLDASGFVSAVASANPEPHGPIVVAPHLPSREGIGPFFDEANIAVAMRFAYGTDDVVVRMARSEREFAEALEDPAVFAVDLRRSSNVMRQ